MMLKSPGMLFLLLILVPLIAWYVWKQRNSYPSIGVSTLSPFAKIRPSRRAWLRHVVFALQLAAIACVIVALARPQTHDHFRTSRIQGTDIVLALDISGSMSAHDFTPSRFAAAKDVAIKFINQRSDDNIGLVVFAGESLSLMPLTNDRAALINAVKTSALNRITSGKAKSKSIILLTDGTNNAGDVPPSTAARIAKQKGVKVYTIGVGTNGSIQITDPYGFSTTTMETKIDEESLKNIASQTGGKYFRATDERMLNEVFAEIDSLEKTTLDVDKYTTTDENFIPWIMAALACYVLCLIIRYTVLRRIP